MIASRINVKFPHQVINLFNSTVIYVADYTEQTKSLPAVNRKDVEISDTNFTDIDSFHLNNPLSLDVLSIKLDGTSFSNPNGTPRSQCEAVFFPSKSKLSSWFLCLELKYSITIPRNPQNLQKAIDQVIETRDHYIHEGVINDQTPCYLIASLPMQSEPFANFSMPPNFAAELKQNYNIILRLTNSVEILDKKKIIV